MPYAWTGIDGIIQAISVLQTNPLVVRPPRNDTRELFIGRRSHGHMALYRDLVELDTGFVLPVRRLREAGFQAR